MQLLEIFLPLSDKAGDRFDRQLYEQVEQELLSHFDGFTAYSRAPAAGLWKDDRSSVEFDELVIYEVMTKALEKDWWKAYRQKLEQRFSQDKILIRSQAVEIIE
jgi:hypothetical protein